MAELAPGAQFAAVIYDDHDVRKLCAMTDVCTSRPNILVCRERSQNVLLYAETAVCLFSVANVVLVVQK